MRQTPIAGEGLVLIALSLILAILFFMLHNKILSLAIFVFFLFCLFFFRNPKRYHSSNEDELISPADGKVMEVGETVEGEFLNGISKKVSIFMSPLDVHVNRAPCEGRIAKVVHRKGEFALAFRKDSDKENEKNYVLIEHGDEKILLVQIAGFMARRIISYIKEGDYVKKGDPVGMIAFGSRVDIYFPKEYNTIVSLSNKVKAGVTPLAKGGKKA